MDEIQIDLRTSNLLNVLGGTILVCLLIYDMTNLQIGLNNVCKEVGEEYEGSIFSLGCIESNDEWNLESRSIGLTQKGRDKALENVTIMGFDFNNILNKLKGEEIR